MTAVSALQSIHKKGLFGDHHKINEKDLLSIAELKNLTIVQIVKYKKSEINLKNIKIDNLNFPLERSKVSSNDQTRILWVAPRSWMIISKSEKIIDVLNENCSKKDFAITDISHSRCVIQIKGLHSKEVLKKGSPVDINNFKKDNCAGTVFHGITILIDMINENPDTFNLLALRSFAESFYHHISDSALEYGYVGV